MFTLMALFLFLFTPTVPRVAIGTSADASAGLVRIAIVGDSTVADYKLDDPHRGWGQLFPEFIDASRVSVQNFAFNGRSTKTFKSEGRWDSVLAFKPDYILIQFGHNDSHAEGRPEATDADTDYRSYLEEYVDSAHAQGATPILVTPMHRGTWDKDGRRLTQELLPYATAMVRVAKEKKVPVIDLYTMSEKAFEKLGSEQLKTLFAFPDTDKTHFNEKGARLLAALVAQEMAHRIPKLKTYLKGGQARTE
jgi:lysophospholipase L1-like esterase